MPREHYSRRQMLTLISTPLAIAGSGAFTTAHAEAFWRVLGHAQIGGIDFSIGVHSTSRGTYGRHPGYYYRTSGRLTHRQYRCGAHCYRSDAYDFHHESCPVLVTHLEYYAPPYAHAPYRDRYDRYDSRYRRNWRRGREHPGRGRRRQGARHGDRHRH